MAKLIFPVIRIDGPDPSGHWHVSLVPEPAASPPDPPSNAILHRGWYVAFETEAEADAYAIDLKRRSGWPIGSIYGRSG